MKVSEGHAAVRSLAESSVVLWAAAPSLEVELTLPGTPSDFEVEVQNAMQRGRLRITSPRGALATELESDVPYDEAAIREGRKHYLRLCQNCHGKDGRALESFDFEATDLTRPEAYRHGATDGDLFFSIKIGAGSDMPGFKDKLTDRQVWQTVWFLRSIGPESARPKASSSGESNTEPNGK